MQERTTWSAPSGALGRLTAAAFERARALEAARSAFEAMASRSGTRASMAAALALGDRVAVIAEIKRRSPSKGSLNEGLDAPARAAMYVAAGARGISVLTEPREFGGSIQDLERIRDGIAAPLLKKDFHVAEIQLLEARAFGASAALLIARALPPARLIELAAVATSLGVEPLIEVRTEAELELALCTTARMIGVNARDLETLQVDAEVVTRLLPLVPPDHVGIAESSLATREDVERVAEAGASAVLVGSSLSQAADPAALLEALACVRRRG